MKYSQSFLTFEGYWATFMFLSQPDICQFSSLNCYIISDWFHWCLTDGKTTLENFLEFNVFRVSQAVPARVLRKCVLFGRLIGKYFPFDLVVVQANIFFVFKYSSNETDEI